MASQRKCEAHPGLETGTGFKEGIARKSGAETTVSRGRGPGERRVPCDVALCFPVTHPESCWGHTTPFCLWACSQGWLSPQCSFFTFSQLARLPLSSRTTLMEHLEHPGHCARDSLIQSWNYIVPNLKQHSGHFQAKVISSLCPMPSSVSPIGLTPSSSLFLQTLYIYQFYKSSHCIINYLYLYLGIPWPNTITMRTGLEPCACLFTAQHNTQTIPGSQLTVTSLTNIPLLLLVSLLLSVSLPVSIYLPSYLVPILTTSVWPWVTSPSLSFLICKIGIKVSASLVVKRFK